MSGRKIVEFVLDKKLDDMRTQIHSDLGERVQEALDIKKYIIAQNYFGQGAPKVNESAEEVDEEIELDEEEIDEEEVNELSKKTLGSYVKKANRDNWKQGHRAGETKGPNSEFVRKSSNRERGVDQATDRLQK